MKDKEKILEILRDIRPEFDFNTEEGGFITNGMLDSFDIISIVADVEDYFGIAIDGAKILPENFESIDAIGNLINSANVL